MFWPRGKIEVFLFFSSPSGLKFSVLLIFKNPSPSIIKAKNVFETVLVEKSRFLEAMAAVPPHELSKTGSLKFSLSPLCPGGRRARGPAPGSLQRPNPSPEGCHGGTAGPAAAPTHPSPISPSERIVESLTAAILNLVELYCSTFNADFQTAVHGSREHGVAQEARLLSCPLSFTVYATHRIPITWAAR